MRSGRGSLVHGRGFGRTRRRMFFFQPTATFSSISRIEPLAGYDHGIGPTAAQRCHGSPPPSLYERRNQNLQNVIKERTSLVSRLFLRVR